jgi:hypothetical protein
MAWMMRTPGMVRTFAIAGEDGECVLDGGYADDEYAEDSSMTTVPCGYSGEV